MPTPRSPRSTTSIPDAGWPRSPSNETAPRALDEQARIRWLRAVQAHLSPQNRTIALIHYYAGARISEVVRLDVNDVHRSARKAQLRIWGKGGKPRTVHIHKQLRTELDQWLEEGPNWPNADHNLALFLNTKGGLLTARAASSIIHAIARNAALDDEPPLTFSATPWQQHSGGEPKILSDRVEHSNPNVTFQIYSHHSTG